MDMETLPFGGPSFPLSATSSNWLPSVNPQAQLFLSGSWGIPVDTRLTNAEDIPHLEDFKGLHEIASNWPSTIELPYALEAGVPPLGRIVLREEYNTTWEFILRHERDFQYGGIVLSGQPGVGITYLLWYLLRRRLSQRLPTIFSLNPQNGPVYLYNHLGVFEPAVHCTPSLLSMEACQMSPAHTLHSIFDMGDAVGDPPDFLTSNSVFTIQGAKLGTPYQWQQRTESPTHAINPWNWNEAIVGMLLHPQFIAQNIPSPDWTLFQAVINAYGFLPKLIYYAYFQPNGRVQEWDAAIASAIASTSALELLQVVTAIPCVSGIVTSIGSSPSLAGLSLSSHPRSSANSTLNCGSVNHNSSFSRILPSTKRNPRSLDIDTSSKFAARQHLMCLWRNPKFLPEAEAQFVTPRSREIMRAIAQRVPLPSETRDLAVFYQRIGGTPVEPFVLSDLMRRLEKGTCKLKTLLGSTGDPPQEQQPILDKKSHL